MGAKSNASSATGEEYFLSENELLAKREIKRSPEKDEGKKTGLGGDSD